jgi:hypothetical protein
MLEHSEAIYESMEIGDREGEIRVTCEPGGRQSLTDVAVKEPGRLDEPEHAAGGRKDGKHARRL